MIKKYWWIVTVAIILRLILATFTYHPDINHFDLAGQVVSAGNISNLYDFFKGDSALSDLNKNNLFNYPPLIYLFHGFFAAIFSPFSGQSTYVHLLFLKLPYLIFDLGIAWLLMQLFESERKKLWTACLWLFNPVALFATFMMGQFDIIPTFFVILSLIMVLKNKLEYGALSIGLGVAFKLFPLLLLIPLVFLDKTSWGKLKLLVLGLLPYLISILPYIFSSGFQQTALVASQTDKSLFARIPVSGGESILLFPALLLFCYLVFYYLRGSAQNLWRSYFIVLLLFFIFTHFHPQWFLWLTPFLIIDMVRTNFKRMLPTVVLLFSFLGLLFSFETSLTLGLFSPIWSQFHESPTLWQFLGINLDNNFYRSLMQTAFVSTALYFVFLYFPRKNES